MKALQVIMYVLVTLFFLSLCFAGWRILGVKLLLSMAYTVGAALVMIVAISAVSVGVSLGFWRWVGWLEKEEGKPTRP